MAIIGARAFYQFGLQPEVASNVLFESEHVIIYPSGTNCVLYNLYEESQQIITGNEKSRGLTALALSDNKRYFAVAEKGRRDKEKPVISIFDLVSGRKKKSLILSEMRSERFNSLSFSTDVKFLVALGGLPNHYLVLWIWDRSKVLASVPLTITWNLTPSQLVHAVSFNPTDNRHVCVAGISVFKQYHYQDEALTVFMLPKVEYQGPQSYLCMAWASPEWLLLGLDCNQVQLFENGELKQEFTVIQDSNDFLRSQMSELEDNILKGEYAVRAIVTYMKGFACSCGAGLIHLFEKTNEEDCYRKLREVEIGTDPGAGDIYGVEIPKQYITSIAVSPSGETLVGSSSLHQLYSLTMSSEIGKMENVYLDIVGQRNHSSTITGCDICIRKPFIVTCSLDRSIRVWNYLKFKLEIYKIFNEVMYSLTLHPSGLYILVGFETSLRLLNILIDDIQMFKEFNIKACLECMFAHGGHMFAAVNGHSVEVYSTRTFDLMTTLKGHTGKIQSIAWSDNDLRLVTSGHDGAIYEWDILTGKRVSENVLKGCAYTSVVLTSDGKTIYAVGSDMLVKEINDALILRQVPSNNVPLTKVVLSHSGRIMYVGTGYGSVRSMKYPLTNAGEWLDFQGHASPITRMRVTYDDRYLVTVSEDATLIIWKIQDREGRGVKRDKEITYANEILVNRSVLEQKDTRARELKLEVDELRKSSQYQLKMRDTNYNERLGELEEKFKAEKENINTKNQELINEMEQDRINNLQEIEEIKKKYNEEIEEKEATNKQKLMGEFEKYQELKEKGKQMQEDYERQLEEMEEKMEHTLAEFTDVYEARLNEMMILLGRAKARFDSHMLVCGESKVQVEDDADHEIFTNKTSYERKLFDERQTINELKVEITVLQKQRNVLMKEIEGHKTYIQKLKMEVSKLNSIILNREKDIASLKKEMQDRDETLQDKERRLHDLKKKNQDLKKFKFVLDYKIEELRKTIEPKEREISMLKEQIDGMDGELKKFKKENLILKQHIAEEKDKLRAAEADIEAEKEKFEHTIDKTKKVKLDIHHLFENIKTHVDYNELKHMVQKIFHKHVSEPDVRADEKVHLSYQVEFRIQRDHLEKAITSLRKQLAKEIECHKADNVRVMQENVALLREITDMRKELKVCRGDIANMKNALEVSRKNIKLPAVEVLAGIAESTASAVMTRELEEAKKVIGTQKKELSDLRQKICKMKMDLKALHKY